MPDISESSGIRDLFMTFGEVQEVIPLLVGGDGPLGRRPMWPVWTMSFVFLGGILMLS